MANNLHTLVSIYTPPGHNYDDLKIRSRRISKNFRIDQSRGKDHKEVLLKLKIVITMDPLSALGAILSLIRAIKAQAEVSSSNVKTCKLLSHRCQDLIPSLESLKTNLNLESTSYNESLNTLLQVLNDCKSFIKSHGSKEQISQFFNANTIKKQFEELNNRLTTSILNLNLGIYVDDSRQIQESQEALNSDLNKIKATLSEIAAANNFRIDQIQNNQGHNEIITSFLQALVENVHQLRSAVNPSSVSATAPPASPTSRKLSMDDTTTTPASPTSPTTSTTATTFSMIDESQLVKGKKIGHGSYGEVFKCIYRGQDFAYKSFEKSLTSNGLNSTQIKKIKKEIQILQLCHHSNIIGFVAATVTPEKAILITELATCSLYTVIHDDSPFENVTFPRKVRWIADIARGLRYLHFNQITHRDLKPANILLVQKETADGRTVIVAKISDFGVSSAIGLSSRSEEASQEQVGTCSYDAPEVCNDALYTAASDIYAFGITANELLTGLSPWVQCRNDSQVVRMVGQGKRPELFVPTTDAEVELMRIIGTSTSQCLAQEASQRPTATSVYNDVTKVSTAIDRGNPSVVPHDVVKAPECPICLAEYTDKLQCYTICENKHSMCENCKDYSISEGICPICKSPCTADGCALNHDITALVQLIANINASRIRATTSTLTDDSYSATSSSNVIIATPKSSTKSVSSNYYSRVAVLPKRSPNSTRSEATPAATTAAPTTADTTPATTPDAPSMITATSSRRDSPLSQAQPGHSDVSTITSTYFYHTLHILRTIPMLHCVYMCSMSYRWP